MDRRIFHLRAIILDDLKHAWTNREMAELLNLSPPHFQRLFKEHLSTTPNAFLNNARFDRAGILLLQSNFLLIKEIGVAVGLTNYGHFARDFKKKNGLTLTAFRKLHWDKKQIPPRAMNDRFRHATSLFATK